jgi:hypothetical protein
MRDEDDAEFTRKRLVSGEGGCHRAGDAQFAGPVHLLGARCAVCPSGNDSSLDTAKMKWEMRMADDYLESGRDGRCLNIELAVLAHEIRILVEVLLMGVQSLMDNPLAAPVKEELGVLAKLAGQGAEALVALDAALDGTTEDPEVEPTRLTA